jgi:hypothetical protein
MYLKAGLLVVIAVLCLVWIGLETQSFRVLSVTLVALWAACRAYYFAFYVIEHYIDDRYRYAGLIDFVLHHIRARKDR